MTNPLNPYSADLQEYFYSAAPAKSAFETLELRHPSFAQPARVVNDLADLTATLEADAPADPSTSVTFMKCNFRITLPESSEGMPSATIEIENVSRILMPYLRQAIGVPVSLNLSYRVFYSDDLAAPGFVLHGLCLKKVTAGLTKVTGMAVFDDFLGAPFPRRFYSLAEFPGLAQ